MKKTRKICLIIPSLQAGGMERVMSELAKSFASKGDIKVHLLLFGITREIFYSVPETVTIHAPSFDFNNKLRLIYSVKTLIFLRRELRSIDPDSVLSFGELWNSFVLLALIGSSYPVYISDRCSPERKFSLFHTYLRKILYPHATGIIAQTQRAKELLYENYKHKNIRVIGNPIREIQDNTHPVRQNIVLTIGRLIKTKHQDILIDIFLRIKDTHWKLIIVGYDHLKQENLNSLQDLIEKNGAEERIQLVGKQSNVDSYYITSKIFAFTSSSEGFPNVIGEAMAAGLPVIAFDCVAGPSDLIEDKQNGFLVPLFDVETFKDRLEELIHNRKLRELFGKRAQEDIKSFSIDQISSCYLTFIMDSHQTK